MTQPMPPACPSRYASTIGPTAGAVVACRHAEPHPVHSNLAAGGAEVSWVSGDENEFVVPCDWCRQPNATHTADEHPLPKTHPDYDAFNDATDDELIDVVLDALRSPKATP